MSEPYVQPKCLDCGISHTNGYVHLIEQDNRAMYAALRRIRELHKPITEYDGVVFCSYCGQDYSCRTIQALEGDHQ